MTDLTDEFGCEADPDDAWCYDQLYDECGDPVDLDAYLVEETQPEPEVLPSGYAREEYKRHGATDFDIGFWGLDQPGAPPPSLAGWVVWGMADDMGG